MARAAARRFLAALGIVPGLLAGAVPAAEPVPATPPPVLLLPPENLTGQPVPLRPFTEEVREALVARGIPLVDEAGVEDFLRRHRVRWTGGVSREIAAAAGGELGVGAILVINLELYDEGPRPAFALLARLVEPRSEARILWFDGLSRTGDQAPGFLDRGVIYDPDAVRRIVLDDLAGRVRNALQGEKVPPPAPERRFRPRSFARRPADGEVTEGMAAVLPFANYARRAHAGEILALHVARQLWDRTPLTVLEPGVIRQFMLEARVVQEGGLSLAQTDLLEDILGVQLAVTGSIEDYQEYAPPDGVPAVSFMAGGIVTASRQMAWSAVGTNRGNDGVYFFGVGQVPTAHDLAARMIRATVDRVIPPAGRKESPS